MRKRKDNGKISVNAISGSHVVLFGLNAEEQEAKGLLGFTILRRKGNSSSFKALKGDGRRFKETGSKERIDSRTAPIQDFMWSDYVVDPGQNYTYRVIPVYGKPKGLKKGKHIDVTITTENPEKKKHAVYFNRGVAGSQRYSKDFGKHRKWYLIEPPGSEEPTSDEKDDELLTGTGKADYVPQAKPLIKPENVPKRRAYKWLSRGLEEAMLSFIAQAKGPQYAIRAAVYEFTYEPVIQAFVDALERGVDVKIVHHAKRQNLYLLKRNYDADTTTTYGKKDPEAGKKPDKYASRDVRHQELKDSVCQAAISAIGRIGLTKPDEKLLKAFNSMLLERKNTQISHNKFIVLLKNGKPVQVWTGSTNFTAGGIFGQSNVGHAVRDEALAKKYFQYWKQLAKDPRKERSAKKDPMRTWTSKNTPDLTALPKKGTITPIFSPRPSLTMLQWYADRIADAKSSVFFTAAFSVDESFLKILKKEKNVGDTPYIRYVMLETRGGKMWKKYKAMESCSQNCIAWGDILKERENGEEDYQQFIETLTGLNHHVEYLHTKYMLVDPLSDDPLVITGSANFSQASTTKNDENMIIIRGNTRVADIFLCEFMRMFNHFRNRNKLNRMSDAAFKKAEYLKPDDSWTKPYYTDGSQEQNERLLFS